jgi:hypothetical protein
MSGGTITRAQLEALLPWERADALRGKRLVDNPAAPRRVAGAGEISRAAFDAMSQPDRAAAIRQKVGIVDADEGPSRAPAVGHRWELAPGGIGFVQVADGDG